MTQSDSHFSIKFPKRNMSLYSNSYVYDVFVIYLKSLHKVIFRIAVIKVPCSESHR